jgi:dienelactone hydrolase
MNKFCLTTLIAAFLVTWPNGIQAQTAAQQTAPAKPKELVVAYKVPGMKDVIVKKDIPYLKSADTALKMDIYYPPEFDFKSKIPAIVFVFGYTNSGQIKTAGWQLRKWSPYTSWCRLVAASGMAAIVYETVNPENDLTSLMNHINSNSEKLKIEAGRIGVYSCSANTPVALANILNSSNNYFRCAAIYYGIFLNPDFKYLSTIDTLSKNMGFIPSRLPESTRWKKDVPILIIHAGKDFVPHTDESIALFTEKAIKQKVPFTLIHYVTGIHGFDVYADNKEIREIIKSTLEFWKFNLKQ